MSNHGSLAFDLTLDEKVDIKEVANKSNSHFLLHKISYFDKN